MRSVTWFQDIAVRLDKLIEHSAERGGMPATSMILAEDGHYYELQVRRICHTEESDD